MTISEPAKSWGVTVLLGIVANALWYWILKAPFHPTWHDAFQLAYFIAIAGVGVFLGKIIGSDKTSARQKFTVVPAASSPCLEINGNDGEVTVRLSVFSALDLNLSYVKARLTTGTHPQAVIFQHGEPQTIERYKRERIEFSKRIGLEEKQALGNADYWMTLKGTAYFKTDTGESVEKDFDIKVRPRIFPEPFTWKLTA